MTDRYDYPETVLSDQPAAYWRLEDDGALLAHRGARVSARRLELLWIESADHFSGSNSRQR